MKRHHKDHDRCLFVFLRRREKLNVRLNQEKVKLRKTKVLFTGHFATDKSLKIGPAKIRREFRDCWS